MTPLVTGATGFLGGWVTRSLAAAGHRPIVLVRDPSRLAPLHGVDLDVVEAGQRKYSFGDWVQDLSQGVSAHQEVMQRLARASAPESDQPTWVRLVWDFNIEVTGNKPSPGHYIGLLVTSEMQQSPEVIVLLQVR